MSDVILIYIVTLAFICVLMALLLVYRYFLGNRYIKQADKLRMQMMAIRRDFPELTKNPREFIEGSIGDIGIEGIMSELGIDPGILKNPLVKGLVEKYAPKVLEQLSKGGKSANNKETETGLL